jgi:hypothetical protein
MELGDKFKRSNGRKEDIRESLFKQINLAIEKNYGDVLSYIKICVMKNSPVVFEYTAEDYLNEAVAAYLTYIETRVEDVLQYTDFYRYIGFILKSRSKQVFRDRAKSFKVSKKHFAVVKTTFYDEDISNLHSHDFEAIEMRALQDALSPSFKAVKRMLEDGRTVREIMATFDMSSRQFYDMKENLRRELKEMGYSHED